MGHCLPVTALLLSARRPFGPALSARAGCCILLAVVVVDVVIVVVVVVVVVVVLPGTYV